MQFEYMGCQKQKPEPATCEQCGAVPEYLHSLAGGDHNRHVCKACAEKMVVPRHRPVPAIAESWSKSSGGNWISRWHVEEGNL